MRALHLSWFLIIFVLLTPNYQCQILTTKCCNYGDELNTNLISCQPINFDNSAALQNAKLTNDEFDVHDNSQIRNQREGEYNTDVSWLPEGLKLSVGSDSIDVVIGRPDMCTNPKTVRLELPRDNHRVDWLANGSLLLNSTTVHGNIQTHVFSPQQFCSDSFLNTNGTRETAILICGACDSVRCVKKCCPLGTAVVCVKYHCNCKPYDAPWSPFHPTLPLPEDDYPYEVVIDNKVPCGSDYNSIYNVFIGRPPYMIQRFWEKYRNEGVLCSDTIVGLWGDPTLGMKRCMRKPPFLQVLDNWLHLPEAIILAVAVVTLLVVPREKISPYSHVHDMSLFWHAACLLARSLLWTVYLVEFGSCSVIPIFVYFFSVGATLWLNVLCINMVCGFWKPPGRPSGRKDSRYRLMFVWYSLYAWGATVFMTAFSSFMWYSLAAPPSLLRPTLFETRTCFIEEEGDGKIATFAYYYGPVSWLLLMNALLFVATAARVRYLRSSGGMLKGKESAANSSFRNSWSVVIYIKLLWLMGVVEMALEMVAWVSNDHIYYTLVVVSGLDLLRAVAIFVFCCCNRRTLRILRERVCACAPSRLREGGCAATRLWCEEALKSAVDHSRELAGRLPRCCSRRKVVEIEPQVVEGRYTPAEADVVSHM